MTISATGGTGKYTYYFKLYKDGILISDIVNSSKNEVFIAGHSNGSYYVEYEVHDSDGTIYSATSPTTTISGF